MKLTVRGKKRQEVALYLEEGVDGVKVKVDNANRSWNLLKITERGIVLASDVPEELGFPLYAKGTLIVLPETY